MSFNLFRDAVNYQLSLMAQHGLFVVDYASDLIYENYLAAFPEGTNPIFRERTEHDCNCCKGFIRRLGNVVSIIDNKMVSIWDGYDALPEPYKTVARELSANVHAKPIVSVFVSAEQNIGTHHNYDNHDTSIKWEHFFYDVPNHYVGDATTRGTRQTNVDLLRRACTELTLDAVMTVKELIAQNQLYRGEEHKSTVNFAEATLNAYHRLIAPEEKDNFIWLYAHHHGNACRFKNSVIGTLLADLSNGVPLEDAVRMFESKVAPANYKRPKALVTRAMIEKAEQKVEELNLTSALARRSARVDDLSITDVIYADRSVKQAKGIFDDLKEFAPVKVDEKAASEINIEQFIAEVVPNAEKLELFFEHHQQANLVNLLSPVNGDAEPLFKWGNGFSWSYNGDLADSDIKQRVEKAGGKTDGIARISLAWDYSDDLDLHLTTPNGNEVFFGCKRSPEGIWLDVDMNAGSISPNPVENITFPRNSKFPKGRYFIAVRNYTKRDRFASGFEMEIDLNGEIHTLSYDRPLGQKETVRVGILNYDGEKFTLETDLSANVRSTEVWGLKTNTFIPVTLACLSPNYWGDSATGNKHYFFMLDGCSNPQSPRGFYNEFLRDDLNEHRKVFEMLASRMQPESLQDQLAGVGFSTTQQARVLFRLNERQLFTLKF